MKRYVQIIEPLLAEDYATLDIVAAFLKITMDKESKEYPQLKEYQQERQREENRYHDRRKQKKKTSRTFMGKKRY